MHWSALVLLWLWPLCQGLPDISCKFTRCSLSQPCPVGTCNNGFCCGAKLRRSLAAAPPEQFLRQDDWAELPRSAALANGLFDGADSSVCIGGFTSSIRCGAYNACPPGLLCEQGIKFCCPMILPVDSMKTTKRPFFHNYRHNGPLALNGLQQSFNPPMMHSYGGPQGFAQYNNINYAKAPALHRYGPYAGGGADFGYRPQRFWSYPCSSANCGAPLSFYSYQNSLPSTFGDSISGLYGPMSALGTAGEAAGEACPEGAEPAGSCVDGRCGSGFQCSRNNVCCQEEVPATVCPDGTQAAGGCVNGQCGFGFTCNQGLCCTNSSQTPRCLDGSQAIGACIGGKCGDGYACTTGNICCPSNSNGCPANTQAIGPCVNGACPNGFSCVNEQCCGPPTLANNNTLLVQCSQMDSNGACLPDSTCLDPGFQCDITNQWCCPNIAGDPVGPCIRGEGGTRLCPDGYACSGPDAGQCYRLDTGTCAPQDQYGPCAAAEPRCPSGYTCIGGFCCNDNAPGFLQRRRRSHLLQGPRP